MTEQTLQALFANLCGQGRCFIVDGEALPVCQRCLGLYAATAFTGICLLITGTWRKGLPPCGVGLLHSVMLLIAMLSGLHIIDAGPTWRLMCGLWTGHVVITWLLTGSAVLSGLSLRVPSSSSRARLWISRGDVSPVLYALAAILFTNTPLSGWWIWSILACVGVIMAMTAVLIGAAMITLRLFRNPRMVSRGSFSKLNPH